MIPLRIASTNPGKLYEFQNLLAPHFQIVSSEGTPLEVVEDGDTYQKNALKKAKAYSERFSGLVLSDDSGLEIDVLKGAPGVFSARWGGDITWEERFQLLYQSLRPYPPETWTARFRCVLCLCSADLAPLFFEGVCEGKIVAQPKGTLGFGYDPVFYSNDLKKTFGEASESEKDGVSHRARACFSLKEWAQKNLHMST